MPIINRVADLSDEIATWRRDFHENPELLYDVHRTAGIVAEKLKAFGCDEVVTGLGQTGVVGVIRGRQSASGKVIGLRADMDALPIEEATDLPYKSRTSGKMHACGHDGHTAMLLGAAKYLSETRNFDGTAIMIFQPAEEGGAGADAMLKDGLMERFGVQEVYGMHNMPGLPIGQFAIRPGSIMAAADRFSITIEGKGAHAARPHDGIDTILVASHVITALQSIASRNVDPLEIGSGVGVHDQGRRNLQRDPADGGNPRHGANLVACGAGPRGEPRPRDPRSRLRGLRRHRHHRILARLSGDGERRRQDFFHYRSGEGDRGRERCRHGGAADDGFGGFLLHAQRTPRRLYFRR